MDKRGAHGGAPVWWKASLDMTEPRIVWHKLGHQWWRTLFLDPTDIHKTTTLQQRKFFVPQKARDVQFVMLCNQKGRARCNAHLLTTSLGELKVLIAGNVIPKLPPAWSCLPLFKKKPYHGVPLTTIMRPFSLYFICTAQIKKKTDLEFSM